MSNLSTGSGAHAWTRARRCAPGRARVDVRLALVFFTGGNQCGTPSRTYMSGDNTNISGIVGYMCTHWDVCRCLGVPATWQTEATRAFDVTPGQLHTTKLYIVIDKMQRAQTP